MSVPVTVEDVNHYFGEGEARKRVLDGVSCEIRAGEIVILTGPSGSGKTTLLTLIGALRSAQEGSVEVLGHQLRGASTQTLTEVRKGIGYIFQLHNLLDCLTTTQNVEMALQLQNIPRVERRERANTMLGSVGLGEKIDEDPSRMSGGQKQRVAIARALVNEPQLILADEPTASLDKKSGRDVVELMQHLAREKSVSVVLVTHDNRILDVADRIIHLEDGALRSFSDAVISNPEHMMNLLANQTRKEDLFETIARMSEEQFFPLLEQLTHDSRQLLEVTRLSANEAFESMLEQALDAFTHKIAQILDADRATLFLLDRERNELWSKAAKDAEGNSFTIRIPRDRGIVGAAVESGSTIHVPDAYADPRFDQATDRETGYRTRNILCIPLINQDGEVFGAAQLLNKKAGNDFEGSDEGRFGDLMHSMGVILESWRTMTERRHGSD